MAIRTISMEDIKFVPEAFEILVASSKQTDVEKGKTAFMEMLHDIGFDIERGVEMEVVKHRPMVHQKEVECPRWVGHERRDPEWMNSKHCTQENRLEVIGCTDLAFQKELVQMGQMPNFTAMFISHIQGVSKVKQKQKAGEK